MAQQRFRASRVCVDSVSTLSIVPTEHGGNICLSPTTTPSPGVYNICMDDSTTDFNSLAAESVRADREAAQEKVRFLGGLISGPRSELTREQFAFAFRARAALIRELVLTSK